MELYRYYEDFGRMGELEGLFFAEGIELDRAEGKTAYFGEVFGKHSDVFSDEWYNNVTLVVDDPEIIKILLPLGIETGYNPLKFLED